MAQDPSKYTTCAEVFNKLTILCEEKYSVSGDPVWVY